MNEPDKNFVEIYEWKISVVHLRALPEMHRNFFIALNIASNDINSTARLLIICKLNKIEDEDIRNMAFAILCRLMRTFSAHIYELVSLIDVYCRGVKKDKVAASHVENLRVISQKIKTNKYYELSALTRNQMTSHYSMRSDQLHLGDFPGEHEFSFFLGKKNGNSISLLGEEVGFFGLVQRKFGSDFDIGGYMDWSAKVGGEVGSIMASHVNFLNDNFEFPLVYSDISRNFDDRFVYNEDTEVGFLYSK